MSRIAIVDPSKCRPSKCQLQCSRKCPVVQMGKACIEVTKTSKLAFISEQLCNGCNICTKVCPFKAISIVNLPKSLDKDQIHRYSANSFKLHRLVVLKPGIITGVLGSNGMGKSTLMKILAGKIKANMGRENCTDEDVINNFKGSELHFYLTKLFNNEFEVAIKPQYVDRISKVMNGKVSDYITDPNIIDLLSLNLILDRDIKVLSGGELQRFAIALICLKKADVYMFDEPTSYLDVKQRINISRVIRDLRTPLNYIMCIEHDLSILDYISDSVCCLYGEPAVYGVVSHPSPVKDGINNFLDGYLPSENLRIRDQPLNFNISAQNSENINVIAEKSYPEIRVNYESFNLVVEPGIFSSSEIIMILGENGMGKTSFIRKLAFECDFNISYKPQLLNPKFKGLVRDLLNTKIGNRITNPQFISLVLRPMNIEKLYDIEVENLSGGEIQKIAIIICLGTDADIYLIDEPSAYLDSEQRIIVSKVIKNYILQFNKTAFIIEHDMMMATSLADKVILFSGEASVSAVATTPIDFKTGMNLFLKSLDVTFRIDSVTGRPRINKYDSNLDREQKSSGNFYGTN